MQYKSFLFPILLVLKLAAFAEAQNIPNKPNVLFLFADDQRADALGASGNPYIRTPNLDQLAQEGSRFTNAYVMGGNHGAVCMASRAMLMSGQNLFRVYDKLKDVHTMPMAFAVAGYTTFGTGKWHNEKEAFEASFQQAKNVYLGGMANHYSIPLRDYGPDGKLGEPTKKSYSTEVFAQTAIDFIKQQAATKDGRPFFCYVAFTVPHDPYSPEASFIDFYPDGSLPLPGNYMPFHPFEFDQLTVRDENLTGWPRKPEVIQMILSDYYSLVTHLDQQIGKIVAALKETGQYENTIIVYAADNGLAAGSHGLLGKQSLYEHSTKVPLIIKGPGVPEGQELDAFAYIHDIYPTLAQLAGLPKSEKLDGLSLVPVLSGNQEAVRSSLFTSYRNTVRAVRDGQYKLVRYPERDYTQLFDLAHDPLELNNLAEKPEMATKKEELFGLMKKWQAEFGDTTTLTAPSIKPMLYDPDTLNPKRKPDQWQPEYVLKRYFGVD
ncbi:sulfatase-like hydrolase/transferase [Algoriphagus aestuariicola]|uniref:Sulfatase-like hydrolase/transferase n=1 Tax=Algoriphagus aestuariicola TaxID=1852016 RepID=A0ABS3BJV3_9BACT|nr:sulfatase-like hydrolase/transferase [Algoriphagus aestuariicola]MBN7799556.1 sulfatase-like hydrolase/transferase [Algoriphagus aestuariicola]